MTFIDVLIPQSLQDHQCICLFVIFQSNIVTVTISHLVLSTGAPVLEYENIRQLFVSYNFLGIKPDELETPFSLPKPKAEQQITFNFSKSKYQITIYVMSVHHVISALIVISANVPLNKKHYRIIYWWSQQKLWFHSNLTSDLGTTSTSTRY